MIDRNLNVVYLLVDEMHSQHPVLVRDQYWDEVFPDERKFQQDNLQKSKSQQSRDLSPSGLLTEKKSSFLGTPLVQFKEVSDSKTSESASSINFIPDYDKG